MSCGRLALHGGEQGQTDVSIECLLIPSRLWIETQA